MYLLIMTIRPDALPTDAAPLTEMVLSRVRLQHLLAARQVFGQRADVAPHLLAWLTGRLGRSRIVVGRRKWCDAGL